MGTDELLKEARKLKPVDRLSLLDAIAESLDKPDPDIEKIWAEEARKRLTLYRAGKIKGIRMEDVL